MRPIEISKKLNVNYRMIRSWLYERKYNNTSVSRTDLLPYNVWLKKSTNGLEGTSLVWQKITSKENIELDDVRDLTTKEDTHTMITNGFITHNCPIETPEGTPIGLRKNLAMLSSITHEDYNEEAVK